MPDYAASPDRDHAVPNALVVYASTHGHTAKIAAYIAHAMHAHGVAVDVHDIASAPDVDPASYDVIVVGASVHKAGHQREIVEWVKSQHAALEQRRSVFFSVSLSAADDSEEARGAAQHCIDEFCADTGWLPTRTERIAGCLQYREYDVFTRQLMRLLMKRMGHPTDTSQDYDYTDWDALQRLGAEIAQIAATVRIAAAVQIAPAAPVAAGR
jgi:menaquinone-dependent protoporphyrinogen oxidase